MTEETKDTMEPVTPRNFAEYARDGGCPVCGSDNIEGDSFDTGQGEVGQEQFCGSCGAGWYAYYEAAYYGGLHDTTGRRIFIEGESTDLTETS